MSRQGSRNREAMPHKTSYPDKDKSNYRTPVHVADEIEHAYRARKEEEEWESEARRYGVGY